MQMISAFGALILRQTIHTLFSLVPNDTLFGHLSFSLQS